jgi:predicted GIY-YIG superfamily endonuclease
MPFYVYILECADGTYYTGHTDDLDARMAQHGDGRGCRYTARRRPLTLLWATDCQSREQAFELEKQVQGWSRAKKRALMRGDLEALPALSRSKSAHVEPVETRALALRQAQGERLRNDSPR